jgi:hypothetical protein
VSDAPHPEAVWPLSPAQRALLVRLGELNRRFGTARFVETPVASMDTSDFPEPWEPTAAALYRLLHRLCWHAHVDVDISVVDARVARPHENRQLTTSEIELVKVMPGRATYELAAFGNDDIAGLLSHTIGAIFLELAPGDPFRTDVAHVVTTVDASLAAIYLGLGVLVANSSRYVRTAQRWVGKDIVKAEQVAQAGGLELEDATLLLAAQDVVRDDHQRALATLHPDQTEWFEAWHAALEPHEDELRILLELDANPGSLPERADEPRAAPDDLVEPDLTKFNRGRTTFRVPVRSKGLAVAGLLGGPLVAAILLPAVTVTMPAAAIVGTIAGLLAAKKQFVCSEPECIAVMATELPECPRCGGTIAETIASPSMRLDRAEQLERSGSRE